MDARCRQYEVLDPRIADIYSKERRSEIMSKIVSKETKPEILMRSILFKRGFRFHKNYRVDFFRYVEEAHFPIQNVLNTSIEKPNISK